MNHPSSKSPPGGGRRLRVLFAEDNRADAELCRQELRKAGFEVYADTTASRMEFEELVRQGEYDLVLADYGLPGWSGMDALQVLKQQQKQIPFILVTGTLGDEKAVECIKAGAHDYVLKDNLARLPHAIEQVLAEQSLQRERQLAQVELRRLNRALLALSRSNRAMLEASDETSLLQAICDLIVQAGGYQLAWVGYAEANAGKTVRPMAWAGVEQDYVKGLRVRWDETGLGRGPTGIALRTAKPFLLTDLDDPCYAPWREAARLHGFTASYSLPLCAADGAAFGALMIYASEPDVFGSDERALLEELARNLSYGIGAIRGRRKQEQAEAELRKYAAELERSNSELQDFASIASHDLQEPLRKIVAFGERLAEHAGPRLDETGRDFLQRMQSAALRMAALIDALLGYSRLATRAEPFQTVDLTQVMFEVMVDLEVRVRESHARIESTVLPKVMADRTQMRQLLLNLLANALKFHRPEVAPVVWVGTRMLPGGRWEITIADNGIGFEETYAERIFRPFQRLHGRSEYEGTGMGLAICRKIVARHGGTILARSQPGQGSTFVVELPGTQEIQEAPCPTPDAAEPSSSPKTTTMTSC